MSHSHNNYVDFAVFNMLSVPVVRYLLTNSSFINVRSEPVIGQQRRMHLLSFTFPLVWLLFLVRNSATILMTRWTHVTMSPHTSSAWSQNRTSSSLRRATSPSPNSTTVVTRPTRLAKSNSSTSPANTVRTATLLWCELVRYSALVLHVWKNATLSPNVRPFTSHYFYNPTHSFALESPLNQLPMATTLWCGC